MSTQPKALFLADVIDNDPRSKAHHDAAAAELRRQREEIETLKAQRDALLEALKAFANEIVPNNPNDPIWVNARAAIAAVEEGK